MASLHLVHVFRADYPGDRAWDLVCWCHEAGADEFTLSAIVSLGHSQSALSPFDQAASPFRLRPFSSPFRGVRSTIIPLRMHGSRTLRCIGAES